MKYDIRKDEWTDMGTLQLNGNSWELMGPGMQTSTTLNGITYFSAFADHIFFYSFDLNDWENIREIVKVGRKAVQARRESITNNGVNEIYTLGEKDR